MSSSPRALRVPSSPFLQGVVSLPRAFPPVLGVGAYLKNAPCLIQGKEAWLGRESGSLDTPAAVHRFEETILALLALASEPPVLIAHDLHPDFPSTRWAFAQGTRTHAVQHHHAHAVAVMAENGVEAPALALALDGFGLGTDGGAWGGELLHISPYAGCVRLGHLKTLPQPGGDVAARQPWRMGAAALWSLGRGHEIVGRFEGYKGAEHLAMMMERGLNAPHTSSAGRLFDAACGLLGVMLDAQEEGQAPRALEALAAQAFQEGRGGAVYEEGWRIDEGLGLDMSPLLARLAEEREAVKGAALFHRTFVAALAAWAGEAAARTSVRRIALCGGCFLNAVLREGVEKALKDGGFEVLVPQRLSPGDGALAFGQACVGASALLHLK